MYLTEKNALTIDAIRQSIQEWLDTDLITKDGRRYFNMVRATHCP